MKVLVTGADGFIGSWLLRRLNNVSCLTPMGVDITISPWNRDLCHSILDISDRVKVREYLDNHQPDVIVLNGAVKSLDRCERNYHALDVNVLSIGPFLEYALRVDAHVVFISSDMVFGSCENPPFCEDDAVAAKNAYGYMKIAGEQIVKMVRSWTIVRTALVYGPMLHEENHLLLPELKAEHLNNQSHLIHWVIQRTRNGLDVPLARNVLCTPTFIEDLVGGLSRIIDTRALGVYHCTGSDRLSRYEFGKQAAACGGRPEHVLPIVSATNELRPLDVSLSNQKTVEALGINITPTRTGLRLSIHRSEICCNDQE